MSVEKAERQIEKSGMLMDELFSLYLVMTTSEHMKLTEIMNPIYENDDEPQFVPSIKKLDETVNKVSTRAKNLFIEIQNLIREKRFSDVVRSAEKIFLRGKEKIIENPYKVAINYFVKRLSMKAPKLEYTISFTPDTFGKTFKKVWMN